MVKGKKTIFYTLIESVFRKMLNKKIITEAQFDEYMDFIFEEYNRKDKQ